MKAILTRCGYRCDLCLAYRLNIEANPSNRQKLSDGWHKYFGFRVQPEDILCDGCMAESPRLIDQNCPVRPCVIAKELENCSHCDEYICEKLTERLVDFEEVKKRMNAPISMEDRRCFLLPYENKARLEQLRKAKEK